MLVLTDGVTRDEHQFFLSDIIQGTPAKFEIKSHTYPDLVVDFSMLPQNHPIPNGYTVTVHLFKNYFHLQQEVIDLRVRGLMENGGRIGYFFRLDALFEKDAVQLDAYTYCYAYYALQQIFSSPESYQAKLVELSGKKYEITDFFDEDTILLVLCNEHCQLIPGFSINNYLTELFLHGFLPFSMNNPIQTVNKHSHIEGKYNFLKSTVNPKGKYSLRLKKPNEVLYGESYITHVFGSLIQKKMEQVTRFIMLYQIIEIMVSKVLPYAIRDNVCAKLTTFNTKKLKEVMGELDNHSAMIVSLFNTYSHPNHQMVMALRDQILDFFIHIQHPEYADPTKHPDLKPNQLFYAFRNKLVHEYRTWHNPAVNANQTTQKVDTIIQLTEIVMAEVISECILQPL